MNEIPQIADKDREHPYSHSIQVICLIIFFLSWILDSFIFKISIELSSSIPLFIRLASFLFVFVIAIKLLQWSHDALLNGRHGETQGNHDHHHPDRVIDTGIMARVRHPLYLGTLLVYLAVFLTTLSMISFAIWIVIFVIYNRMASFEEKQLIEMFGESYLAYKKQVPKWLPRYNIEP